MARVTETTKKSEPLGVRIAQGINSGLSMAQNISNWQSKLQELDMQKQQQKMEFDKYQVLKQDLMFQRGNSELTQISKLDPTTRKAFMTDEKLVSIAKTFQEAGVHMPPEVVKTLLNSGDAGNALLSEVDSLISDYRVMLGNADTLTDDQLNVINQKVQAFGSRVSTTPVFNDPQREAYGNKLKQIDAVRQEIVSRKQQVNAAKGFGLTPEQVEQGKALKGEITRTDKTTSGLTLGPPSHPDYVGKRQQQQGDRNLREYNKFFSQHKDLVNKKDQLGMLQSIANNPDTKVQKQYLTQVAQQRTLGMFFNSGRLSDEDVRAINVDPSIKNFVISSINKLIKGESTPEMLEKYAVILPAIEQAVNASILKSLESSIPVLSRNLQTDPETVRNDLLGYMGLASNAPTQQYPADIMLAAERLNIAPEQAVKLKAARLKPEGRW